MTKRIIYCKNYNFANVQNKSKLITIFSEVTNVIITGVVENSFAPKEINSDCTLEMFNGSFVSQTVLTTVYLLCLYFFIATTLFSLLSSSGSSLNSSLLYYIL